METTIIEAVKVLTTAIKNDKDFRESYKANIAMAFKDEVDRYFTRNKTNRLNRERLHILANKAADNFLNLWCK